MFFLNMFLSATRAPSPSCAAQAFQGLPLCSSPLSPGQASGVTSRDRSHQLHTPIASPRAYPVPSFTYLKQRFFIFIYFFLFSVPALGAQGHPGSGSGGAVGGGPLPPTSRRELDAGQPSCWEAMNRAQGTKPSQGANISS